jgi:hypothetical protein
MHTKNTDRSTPTLERVGALARWTAEMRRGTRGKPDNCHTWKLDDLWAAACCEKTALQFEEEGDLHGARYWMEWALCLSRGIADEWESGSRIPAHETKAGKDLLAKLRAATPTAAPVVFAPAIRRRTLTAGLAIP